MIKDQQKHVQDVAVETSSLQNSYQAKARQVRAAAAKNAKKGRKPKQPPALVYSHHCAQADAKRFVPDGASIWRSNTRGEWCGHCPPFKRCSESFAKHGNSEQALQSLLRTLWTQKLSKDGLTVADCPIQQLF